MAEMVAAIKSVLISEMKTALASFFPASPAALADEYINDRPDPGDPTAMSGHWYCAIHRVTSRNSGLSATNGGQPYVNEIWSAAITITVRSSFVPNDRFPTALDLLDSLARTAALRCINRPYEIMALINAAFAVSYTTTNGLTIPFAVQEPVPQRVNRDPSWLKAISKKVSQIPAMSATISLTNATQIQVVGGAA